MARSADQEDSISRMSSSELLSSELGNKTTYRLRNGKRNAGTSLGILMKAYTPQGLHKVTKPIPMSTSAINSPG